MTTLVDKDERLPPGLKYSSACGLISGGQLVDMPVSIRDRTSRSPFCCFLLNADFPKRSMERLWTTQLGLSWAFKAVDGRVSRSLDWPKATRTELCFCWCSALHQDYPAKRNNAVLAFTARMGSHLFPRFFFFRRLSFRSAISQMVVFCLSGQIPAGDSTTRQRRAKVCILPIRSAIGV